MPLLTLNEVIRNGLPTIPGRGAESVVQDHLIREAEETLAQYLGFPRADDGRYHLDTVTYTEFVSGPPYGRPEELLLPVRPVATITTIHSSAARLYDATTLVASGNYTLDGECGVVVAAPGFSWVTAYRGQQVVFTAGFGVAGSGTAPGPIVLAVSYQVQAILSGRRHGPVVDQLQNGAAQQDPQRVAIDQRAASLLEPFRLCRCHTKEVAA